MNVYVLHRLDELVTYFSANLSCTTLPTCGRQENHTPLQENSCLRHISKITAYLKHYSCRHSQTGGIGGSNTFIKYKRLFFAVQ